MNIYEILLQTDIRSNASYIYIYIPIQIFCIQIQATKNFILVANAIRSIDD